MVILNNLLKHLPAEWRAVYLHLTEQYDDISPAVIIRVNINGFRFMSEDMA
ncbi:hypothetical protein GCM10009131_27280 [Morganella psychrotolerans]